MTRPSPPRPVILRISRASTLNLRGARDARRRPHRAQVPDCCVSPVATVENLVRASAVITRAASSPARTMATAADRFNINSQLEHLQTRYVGTGHADTNRFEWAVNIHRDSYASYFGRHSMLQYFALAENESIGRVRYNMMQVRERERPPPPRAWRDARRPMPVTPVRADPPVAPSRSPTTLSERDRRAFSFSLVPPLALAPDARDPPRSRAAENAPALWAPAGTRGRVGPRRTP